MTECPPGLPSGRGEEAYIFDWVNNNNIRSHKYRQETMQSKTSTEASVALQWVKQPSLMSVSHCGVLLWILAVLSHTNMPGKAVQVSLSTGFLSPKQEAWMEFPAGCFGITQPTCHRHLGNEPSHGRSLALFVSPYLWSCFSNKSVKRKPEFKVWNTTYRILLFEYTWRTRGVCSYICLNKQN